MWIKICANTNVEDARLAAELGADAVGFVFAESARQISVAQVAGIIPQLPANVEKIGVFSSDNAAEIARIVRETGLTGAQLHGRFEPELLQTLRRMLDHDVVIMQAVHWRLDDADGNEKRMKHELRVLSNEASADRVLVDSSKGSNSGGTGLRFNWESARSVLHVDQLHKRVKLVLAGGLNPQNIAEAIETLRPWGVDVASGVEASKGRKDAKKMESFILTLRQFGSSPVAGLNPGNDKSCAR